MSLSDSIKIEIPELENKELEEVVEVEFWADIEMVDNGIGSYECHGYVGRDVRIEPEVQDIHWDKSQYTDEQNVIIKKYVDEHFEKLSEDLTRDYEEPERDID